MPLPQFPPRVLPPNPILSSRQEAFCRRFAAAGNAAEAARRAGYAEASARQTGHGLLERPHIIERIRAIRQAWRATARDEAQVLLARRAGAAPECRRPESADGEDPDIGNPEPGVGDMPPYPGGLASPDRGGPDLQKGDDAFTDAYEAGWMNDRRGGLLPFDPLAPDDPEGRFALAAGAIGDDPFGAAQDAEPGQHDKS